MSWKRKYPVHHPEVINKNFDNKLESYFGFVKCKILPPKKLYLPVLPMRVNNKLEFILCLKCAVTSNQNDCEHDDEERA